MKTIKIVMLGMLFAFATNMDAQVSANLNTGTPPVWATAVPPNVDFYYLPEIETYYDVPAQQYIYLNEGAWIHTGYLPARYRGYDLYQSHPVFLTEYNGRQPYLYFKEHKMKYKGKGHYKGHFGKVKHKGKKGGHGKKD